ncbi:hypothetical protein Plim_0249 [Planctopirus limnophila DSM 3776]|uniref:Uncharacterized protein n=1 Tax=Planctopirus limnophila (strain ATCC 43296 / DSM 3776 / IFAM 1008 / Mu 290) TaxID=521674 RepID=D5SNU6_PLAL2|nr:hypothetical protein [Planctopirus limnophila]ADG66101.1 hypothetical protein Plim_0249 [Planctopirus limnophila DSM 3776]
MTNSRTVHPANQRPKSARLIFRTGFLWTAVLIFPEMGDLPSAAWAQPAAPAQPTAPVARPVATISWLDAGIFAALAGGALFAVCRASNRM